MPVLRHRTQVPSLLATFHSLLANKLTNTAVRQTPSDWALRRATRILAQGGIVAYPTEAVYGLGCDPLDLDTVARLIALKQRPVTAGLILIAAEFRQLAPWLAPMDPATRKRVLATWPGPVTWVLPAAAGVPEILTGGRPTVAVRVTAHAPAAALCRAWGGALVSTSANIHGRPPARSALGVRRRFGGAVERVLNGPTGGRAMPTEIRDGLTGRVLRPA